MFIGELQLLRSLFVLRVLYEDTSALNQKGQLDERMLDGWLLNGNVVDNGQATRCDIWNHD